jgi:hypothetical protein
LQIRLKKIKDKVYTLTIQLVLGLMLISFSFIFIATVQTAKGETKNLCTIEGKGEERGGKKAG